MAFLRSAVDFDGLTRGEIFSRLFFWWFGPGFVALFLGIWLGPGMSRDPRLSLIGPVLTALVVWRDASRAQLGNPLFLAVVAGALPLLGWWYYARVRSPGDIPGEVSGSPAPPNRASRLRRLLDPFAAQRVVLLTRLSTQECGERLRARRIALLSPGTWLARYRDRPVHGRVWAGGFALKRRHALTREGLITQASGRYETRADGTLIRIRIGLSVVDRIFVVIWFAWIGLFMVFFISTFRSDYWFWIPFVLIFIAVFLVVRLISLDDDAFLFTFLTSALEAEDVSARELT